MMCKDKFFQVTSGDGTTAPVGGDGATCVSTKVAGAEAGDSPTVGSFLRATVAPRASTRFRGATVGLAPTVPDFAFLVSGDLIGVDLADAEVIEGGLPCFRDSIFDGTAGIVPDSLRAGVATGFGAPQFQSGNGVPHIF